MFHPVSTPDPLGLALQAYLDGNEAACLRVDSSITEDEELPVSYLLRSWAEMPLMERMALESCEGKVLDIGAGAGCHAKVLERKGVEVVSLDLSPGAVQFMEVTGIKDARLGNIFFWEEETYDTLLMLMNGIGLVGSMVGLEEFLEQAKTLLAPGGQIILESTDNAYMYTQTDLLKHISPPEYKYYGEQQFQMSFEGKSGPIFDWLFIDQELLGLYAGAYGYEMKLLEQGAENYLATLTLSATT